MKSMLLRKEAAFSKTPTEIGCCNLFKASLPLKPGTGFMYNKPRQLSAQHREIADKMASELLVKGVIRLSKSLTQQI